MRRVSLTMLVMLMIAILAGPASYSLADVLTGTQGLVSRVAPGELLPISLTLSNFGNQQRVDVRVTYEIVSERGSRIYFSEETVAVETTASFIKNIQIPFDTPPGKYIVKSWIVYQDQIAPAIGQFPFSVERKFVGLFQSDFYIYGGVVLVVGIATGTLGHFWIRRRRMRLTPYEYSNVPGEARIFYEIISDIIMEMRYRAGDMALDIADDIDGLKIDENSGRVLDIKTDPAKIVAVLILKYEKLMGQKVSFAMRQSRETAQEHLAEIDKNLVVIKKYFK